MWAQTEEEDLTIVKIWEIMEVDRAAEIVVAVVWKEVRIEVVYAWEAYWEYVWIYGEQIANKDIKW